VSSLSEDSLIEHVRRCAAANILKEIEGLLTVTAKHTVRYDRGNLSGCALSMLHDNHFTILNP
jgi:hypothetical protein